MRTSFIKHIFLSVTALLLFSHSWGQTNYVAYNSPSSKVNSLYKGKEDTLRKQFEAKGLKWPARYVYIRSFKYDSQLEVWVKNTNKEPYKLFRTYRVCMQSGTMGPKRLEGDFQVPEGIYHIDDFNPNSNYHLSLGLNYPNASDRILSDSLRPGGEIYIHGSCVSVGCVALSDQDIEDVYIITSYARANGLEFIPVHVFPARYNVKRSADYLASTIRSKEHLKKFEDRLKDIFDYFNEHKQIPIVLINKKGEYVIN
jgi:murein L,D-transpeptidase YafK